MQFLNRMVFARTGLLHLGVLLLVVVALAACSGKHETSTASTTPQDVMLTPEQQRSIQEITVAASQYRNEFTTTGVVNFDQNHATEVLAPFSGPVAKLLVTLGQKVQKGQALALVESPDFTTAVGAYRSALIAAKAADEVASNDRILFQHQAISARDNAAAEAAAIGADANRDAALQTLHALHMDPGTIAALRAGKQLSVAAGVIRAPIAGTVVAKSIAPGQTLAAGTTSCFTIADTSTLWVMAQVFGQNIAQVQVGDPAEIDTGDSGPAIAGTVTNVGAVVNPDTRAVTARVAVANPAGVLKQQMYVEVHIRSQKTLIGLLIPVSAVLRDDQNLPFVYVVKPDGSYARRPVTLGARIGKRFVVPQGLKPGDKVVVDGAIFLHFIQTQ
ncbi:MAG: efflux RND transporter periplasmic adaptor subunit [Gammaproteobacteria bacterium]